MDLHDGNGGRAFPRIALMGLGIARVREDELIAHVMRALERGRGGWVVTANLDQLRQFRTRHELRPLLGQADLVVADGMPLVWASRLQGTPLPERVAGSELIWTLTAAAADHRRTVYLLGDVPEVRRRAERQMRARCPNLRVVGSYSPPACFENERDEVDRIRDRLRHAKPDVVYVALGFPKQERLIAALHADLPGTWFMGVGASLSFAGGYVKRAPPWVARAGLEWAHRLLQEPRRLARRYLVHGLPFAARLFAHCAGVRVARRRRPLAPDRVRWPG